MIFSIACIAGPVHKTVWSFASGKQAVWETRFLVVSNCEVLPASPVLSQGDLCTGTDGYKPQVFK